jgi:predicted transcriptional regulator
LGPRLDLRGLREGVGRTQAQIAEAATMDQGDVSRLEKREDAKLSTLRRYVRALGGQLELVVVLKTGHRLRQDL